VDVFLQAATACDTDLPHLNPARPSVKVVNGIANFKDAGFVITKSMQEGPLLALVFRLFHDDGSSPDAPAVRLACDFCSVLAQE